MMNVLSARNRRLIGEFARLNSMLALDFDGTLAPIMRRPESARMRRQTRALLQKAAALYPCAIISGRSIRDLKTRIGLNGVTSMVGNHGAEWEWSRPDSRGIARAKRWAQTLARELRDWPGVEIENKGLSLAVHYRGAADRARAARAINRAASGLEGTHAFAGKCVVNIVPRNAPDKGTALESMRRMLRCDAAIYIGDDTTDESAFRWKERGRLLTVRIGKSRRSFADFYVRDQRSIDALLRALISEREKAAPCRTCGLIYCCAKARIKLRTGPRLVATRGAKMRARMPPRRRTPALWSAISSCRS
ncbi:MAG: trehalose-phosphatase [Acidobacteriota bacterium]